MDATLAALEGTAVAESLRFSRWLYAAVNAVHILGIALLVGATVPLDLRLLGVWRSVPRRDLVRVLTPVAGLGLAVAIGAGVLLFAVRAREYAEVEFLQVKLGLVAAGILSTLALHRAHGAFLETASEARLAVHAVISMTCWIGALACGRLIAFAAD